MYKFAKFTPHYVSWQCKACKANNFSEAMNDCVSNGRYCANDPDNTGPLKGSDVIIESLN